MTNEKNENTTERLKEAVRENEERYQSLFYATCEGIFIHDKGKVVDANHAAAEMLGFDDPADIIGKSVLGFVSEDSQQILKDRLAELEQDPYGSPEPFQAVGRRKDGTTFDIEILAKAFTWNGKPIRAAAVRDITERARAQEALRRINEELEQKVEERTRALRVNQGLLIQSEKMAALGQLIAGVAHEINTPLGAMKSNNDTLIRSIERLKSIINDPSMPAELRENTMMSRLLDSIQQLNEVSRTAADRITNIVNSLRNFARLDQAEVDEVDLHEGLESTLTLVHHEFKNRIEIRKHYSELPLVSCHPNQINQVFMNILVNASQAIQDKGTVDIKTFTRDGMAVVEITDSGKGISQETLERIFDPGFTTKGSGVGTGLGLSIVHQIIKDHNGAIEVESEPGKGATFRIILPAQ